MSRNILIVESASDLSRAVRAPLENRGFAVNATSDGKGSVELVRRSRPDLVVMEVELSAGQNGYILCGKLKKDDDLKNTPVVVVGSPDGFAQHRKLKTRADDYLAKPLDAEDLVAMVGALIGFPEPESEVVDDESVSLSADEDGGEDGFAGEEIEVDAGDGETVGDPELDALDAFGSDEGKAAEEVEAEVSEVDVEESPDDAFAAAPETGTRIQFAPRAERPAAPARPPAFGARTAELERARDEAEDRARAAELRAQQAEADLAERTAELEAARATRSGNDKETFALREAGNRKDKEILRLKSEIHEKDNELVELRDRVLELEQKSSEASEGLTRKDAQIRGLSQKADQIAQDRKRVEAQLAAAREEARSAATELETAQAELDTLRSELEAQRSEAEAQRSEAESQGAEIEAQRADIENLKAELQRAQSIEEERAALARRVSELEETVRRHEDRVARFYARLKEDEQVREKARKALSIALQLLDQPTPGEPDVDIDLDEPADA